MEFLVIVIAVYGALQWIPSGLVQPTSRPFIALAVGMILTGVEHAVNVPGYERIMHDWIPNKPLVIWISVTVRILSGLALLFPGARRISSWVCFGLYCVVLPVNLRIAFAGDSINDLKMPVWRRWLRLLLHAGWLAWTFWCTQIS